MVGGQTHLKCNFGPCPGLFFFFFFNFYYFIYLLLAVLGLHCCQGYCSDVECRLLTEVASLVSEHGL